MSKLIDLNHYNLVTLQDISLNGDASFNNDVFISNNLVTNNDIRCNNRLFILGDVSLNNDIYIKEMLLVDGDASLNANLRVSNDTTLNKRLFVVGDASLNSNLYIKEMLLVDGDASLNANLKVSDDATLNDRLFVSNDASFNNDVFISNNLVTNNDIQCNNNLFILGDVSWNPNNLATNCIPSTAVIGGAGGSSAFSANGDDIYFNNGNVGIGTTSPGSKLDVNGTIRINGGTLTTSDYLGTPGLTLNGFIYTTGIVNNSETGTSPAAITFGSGNTLGNDQISLVTGGLTRMYINSSGNVGIGTTSPSHPLHVNGTVYATQGQFQSTSTTNPNSSFVWGQNYSNTGRHYILFGTNVTTTATNSSNPNVLPYLEIKGTSWNRRSYSGRQTPSWRFSMDDHWPQLEVSCYEFYGNTIYDFITGYFSARHGNHTYFDFTGQHRSFIEDLHVNDNDGEKYKGLIVCANKDSYTLITNAPIKGKDAITINESLPDVSLSKKYKDKTVYGVISSGEEDQNGSRKYEVGNFVSTYPHQHGDIRFHINALGEGAIWVCNEHGNLESGDYITSTSIPGYGVLQDDDLLHNYTVAKITMSCDFQPKIQYKKQIIKQNIEFTIDASNNCYDMSGNVIYKPPNDDTGEKTYKLNKYEYTHDNNARISKVTENILNEHGEIQWEDTTEQEYAYEIRHVDPSGNIISKEQHDITISNGGSAYIAAFVGCTYHCG